MFEDSDGYLRLIPSIIRSASSEIDDSGELLELFTFSCIYEVPYSVRTRADNA